MARLCRKTKFSCLLSLFAFKVDIVTPKLAFQQFKFFSTSTQLNQTLSVLHHPLLQIFLEERKNNDSDPLMPY